MKAIIFSKVRKYKIKDTEIPNIDDNEVLVKNNYAGFCGTDLHILEGNFIADYPIIPGHEFSGIVEKTGKYVRNFKKGDKVVINPNIDCGECYYCKKNQQNFCLYYHAYGVTKNGGFAEYSKIRSKNLHKINTLDLREACLVEPLSCVIYGLNKIKVEYGDKIIIFGAGPIGIIILQLLKIRGVSEIVMIDIDKGKLKLAEELGASKPLLYSDGLEKKLKSISKYGFDILIDATGQSSICEEIIKFSNNNARILFYGVCNKNSTINISPYQIFRKDLSIYGAFSLNRTMSSAIELLNKKRIDLKKIISHEFKISEFQELLAVATDHSHMKIIIKCIP